MKDYSINIRPYPKQVRVSYRGTLLANTRRALQLDETGHGQVLYFPIEDVKMELFEATERRTHCPLKGDASYWSLTLAEENLDNLIWGYKNPFTGVSDICGYVAFYHDRVDIESCD